MNKTALFLILFYYTLWMSPRLGAPANANVAENTWLLKIITPGGKDFREHINWVTFPVCSQIPDITFAFN